MTKRSDIIRAMYIKGMTYEEIGQMFGISRQAAYQATLSREHFHEHHIRKIKYEGLRDWMLYNRITMSKLEDLCGRTNLKRCLIDEFEPNKRTIDIILRITGLTYEQCFKERNRDDKV